MTHQIIPHIFYTYPLFFVLNQPFSTKKRRSPALNPFVLGCQRRVALPTKTKDYPRIVILVDNNSYLTLFERSLRVRLSNTTPLFLYIFAGLIEPVFLLYKKGGHPPWIPAFTLYTLDPTPATPLLYTLQHPSPSRRGGNERYVYSVKT